MKGFGIKYLNDELIITPRFKENQFDNFMYEDSQFSIGLEGVVLNSSQLKEQTASLNLGELLITLYSDNQQLFLQQLSGEFCGWLWDKYANKLFVFTNYTGTRKVFYSYKNQHLIADTDLLNMVNYQKAHGYRPVLDIDYAYSLLTVGNTLENQTPIKEIKKLRDAEMICLNMNRNTLENSFYTLVYPKFMGSKKEAIKGLHQRFQKAVRLEYEKDSELGLKTVALLSGGLDSRIALFSAMQQGFKIDQVVCFSQKGYWDEKIAKQIATDYNLPLQCIYLNGGEYLVSIDEVTSISDGMVRYTGGIHTNFAFKSVDKKNVGLIHGGQLGNDVLGGFNPKAYQASPTTEKIIQFPRYFEKSQDFFNQVIAEYDSEELFYYRNLGYNFSVIGSYVAEEFSYQTAPFMHPEFLAFSQSLPEEWKMDHAIYIEWVSLCFPEATHYRWERTLLRPNAKWKTKFGDKVVKRMYNLILNRIFKRNDLGQMTAYEFYFDENDAIKNELHQYYHKNIGLLDTEIELQKDIREIFNKGSFGEKMIALSLLGAMKRFFA